MKKLTKKKKLLSSMSALGAAMVGAGTIAGTAVGVHENWLVDRYEGLNRETAETVKEAAFNYLLNPSNQWNLDSYEYNIQQRSLFLINMEDNFTYGNPSVPFDSFKILLDKTKPAIGKFTKIISYNFGNVSIEDLELRSLATKGILEEGQLGGWMHFDMNWEVSEYSMLVEDENGRQYTFSPRYTNPQKTYVGFSSSAYWAEVETFVNADYPGIENLFGSKRTILYDTDFSFLSSNTVLLKIIY